MEPLCAEPPRLGHYGEYRHPPPPGVDHARNLSYASTDQKLIINLSWRSSFVSAFAVGRGWAGRNKLCMIKVIFFEK